MARLLLVRHGESTWNATGRWQGWADPPLSDLGRAQAEAAAPAAAPVDAVVSSDLRRARETAELMAARVDGGLARLAARFAGQRVLVVTHGGVVRNLERAFGIEPEPLPNLGGREVFVDPETGAMELGDRLLLLSPEDV